MVMRTICAIVFCIFSLIYLYFYQADIIAVAQHVLSGGKTVYNKTVGTVIITAVLMLLQMGVFSITGLRHKSHFLTYVPSMFALLFITDISSDFNRSHSFGWWWVALPVSLVVYALLVIAARRYQSYERADDSRHDLFFSRIVGINLFMMALMIFTVGCLTNSDKEFHARARMEQMMKAGDWMGAMTVAQRQTANTPKLTMLRAYGLSKLGKMGEKFFEHEVTGGSDAILPSGEDVRMVIYPTVNLYKYLGAVPGRPMSNITYLNILVKTGKGKAPVKDYLLCAYLMDKNLDAFANEIGKYYAIDNTLPKHYKEALVLYSHLRSDPIVVYKDNVIEQDYKDMRDLQRKYTDPVLRRSFIRKSYVNTYWYYYLYGSTNT